jgi:catalase
MSTVLKQLYVQKKYLAQIFNISPEYSQSVYDNLKEKKFQFSEVEELSKTAQEWYKEKKFLPSEGDGLVGYLPQQNVYNA